MASFKAIYFDGNSSIAHNVEVIISPTYLEIIFLDNNSNPLLWKIAEFKNEAHTNKKYVRLLYGEYPSQILEIENDDIHLLQDSIGLNKLTKPTLYTRLTAKKTNIFLLFIAFIFISAGTYFYILPRLTMPIVNSISKLREIQLGNILYKSILSDKTIDSNKTILVNNFWKEMHYSSIYPVKITVIKNDEINAFALPGGNIFIYDSILATMKNYNELAALLSHEYVHIKNRHSLKSIVSAYSSMILIQLSLGNTNSTITSIFQNANTFTSLKYSRKLEKEADEQGMQLMYEHQIAPIGMYQLFKKLEESEKVNGVGNIPEFLNNHPIIKDRLLYSKQYANKYKTTAENKILEELFISIKHSN